MRVNIRKINGEIDVEVELTEKEIDNENAIFIVAIIRPLLNEIMS